eukprot:UN00447
MGSRSHFLNLYFSFAKLLVISFDGLSSIEVRSMIGRFLATNTLVIMTIQISRFYRLLRLREEQQQWRSGWAGGTGSAAKMLISKFRSNNDVNGRVPAKASKRHALYKQAQKRVKNHFAKETSVFEKALPDT